MGIKGLWPKRAIAKDTRVLNEFCLTRGFWTNNREQRSVVFGVHASDLLDSLKASRRYPCVRPGSPTETFFGILCKFSEAAAVFIFVFDGPASPKYIQNEEDIYHDTRRLILHFGYCFIEAEGEAVSFLASLSHSNVIDGVISEDNDLLALGTQLVLRVSREQSLHDLVYDIHSLDAIKRIMHLEQEGIILVALLSGNNVYAGLKGCGLTTSIQLGHSDLGKLLVTKFRNLSQYPPALHAFLRSWRLRLNNELENNARGFLAKRRPQAAKKITDEFPNLDVLDQYINTMPSLPLAYVENLSVTLKPRQPDIARLTSFCREQWHWSDPRIVEHFSKFLLKGMVFRMLHSVCVFELVNS
ncbi:Xeroderma pigmentosum G I-region [Marasmius tenuissimus]|uniref:Xeroderma pigmentosum G I-region n=1 Tax=Marasmius tenuissimus TaxID=585030 RepID=A0ABR2ZID3_9AGAR